MRAQGASGGRNLVIEPTMPAPKPQPAAAGPGAASPAPAPANPAEKQRGRDEHLGLRFWIQIDGVEIAGFCECSPITIETETFDYAEGGLNTFVHRLPVRTKFSNITLKRGIDPGRDLYRWFMSTLDGNTQRKNITINIYGPQGPGAVREWHLRNAYPVKWTGPDLRTEAGAVAVESLEFAYESIVSDNLGAAAAPGALPAPSPSGAGARGLAEQKQNQQTQQQIQQSQQLQSQMGSAQMGVVQNRR